MGLLTAIRKFRYPQSTDAFNPPLHFKQLADDVDTWTGNNVVPVVTDSADRDAKFPSPTQGLRAFRRDLAYVETYLEAYNAVSNPGGAVPAGWYPPVGTVLGMAVADGSNFLAPGPSTLTFVTGSRVVAYTPNTPIIIQADFQMNNAGSGVDRMLNAQLFEDGVAIGTLRSWAVPFITGATFSPALHRVLRTPSAGVHTYELRVYANAATAIYINEANVRLLSLVPKA